MSERCAEKDRMRGTGGNRFIGTDPTAADLMRSINDQLGDLREWATDTGRVLDLAEVTISTKRIPSGVVSVSVTADLADDPTRVIPPGSSSTKDPAPDTQDSEGSGGLHRRSAGWDT
jgi:hypothetical protein